MGIRVDIGNAPDPRSAPARGEGWIFDRTPIIGTKKKWSDFKEKFKAGTGPQSGWIPDWMPVVGTRDKFDRIFGTKFTERMQDELKEKQMDEYRRTFIGMAGVNKDKINKWIADRPNIGGVGKADRSAETLIEDAKAGRIRFNPMSEEDFKQAKIDFNVDKGANAWWQDADESRGGKITFREDDPVLWSQTMPHEGMHYFASHKNRGKGSDTPKRNPYQWLDQQLRGWLPSFHPAGTRPDVPGMTPAGKWWNENRATKDKAYSRRKGYHPWYDEHAYDTAMSNKPKQKFKDINWEDPSNWGGPVKNMIHNLATDISNRFRKPELE